MYPKRNQTFEESRNLGTNQLHDLSPKVHRSTGSTLHKNEHLLGANCQSYKSHAETLCISFLLLTLTCSKSSMIEMRWSLKMNSDLVLMTMKMLPMMNCNQRSIQTLNLTGNCFEFPCCLSAPEYNRFSQQLSRFSLELGDLPSPTLDLDLLLEVSEK